MRERERKRKEREREKEKRERERKRKEREREREKRESSKKPFVSACRSDLNLTFFQFTEYCFFTHLFYYGVTSIMLPYFKLTTNRSINSVVKKNPLFESTTDFFFFIHMRKLITHYTLSNTHTQKERER